MTVLKKILKFVMYIILIALLIFLALYLFRGCQREASQQAKIVPEIYQTGDTSMTARTNERFFEVYQNGTWNKIFLKGANIGSSTPGSWFTEFAADRQLYRSWLEDIGNMNLNMIRLYTLFDPAFYHVLKEYNEDPSTPTIWLMQEIWPDDFVPGCNFHHPEYKSAYKREVEIAIDALHGNLQKPGRAFRAYGNYTADVSPYLLGVLIGREFEPEEVENTNAKSPEYTSHLGRYVRIDEGTPTEVWLAELCDFTMNYVQSAYQWQYPVGFVSWPTLDPLTHPSEREPEDVSAIPAYNDREEIIPDRFYIGENNLAGFFGAYHIYPNYPDFMNNEPGFAEFSDDQGTFRYIGYLHDFMAIHPPYPAVVAEFGISTSLNTAHYNPDGFHHGGLSEDVMAPKIIRMVDAIIDQGYAGSIIFAWTDEWAKKTWNTEPYMSPWDRNVLWKNAMDPEQNYGVVSVEPDHTPFTGSSYRRTELSSASGKGSVRFIEKDVDEAFLHLALTFENLPVLSNGDINWNDFDIYIAIDTLIRDAGEFVIPVDELPELPTGVEFLVHISSPDNTTIKVIPPYNRAEYAFTTVPLKNGVFESINAVVNRERLTLDGRRFPALLSNQSVLNYGQFDPFSSDYYSLAHWYADPDSQKIYMRLPWMLLGVTDPSSGHVYNDTREFLKDPDSANFLLAFEKCADELPEFSVEAAEENEDWKRIDTEQTDGFLFYIVTTDNEQRILDFQPRSGNSFTVPETYMWKHWEEPSYRYRLKKSYQPMAEYFRTIH